MCQEHTIETIGVRKNIRKKHVGHGRKGFVNSMQVMSFFPLGVLLHGTGPSQRLHLPSSGTDKNWTGLGNPNAEKFVLKNRSSALGVWVRQS